MNNTSIIKFTFIAIIASSFVLDIIQAGGDNFQDDQYLGVWYTIGTTLQMVPNGDVSCDWIEVTKRNSGSMTLLEVGRSVINGVPMKNTGHGMIRNSILRTTFPTHHSNEETFTVPSYNNGRDLILHDTNNVNYHILISRDTTKSIEAATALERHASKSNHHVMYITHQDCSYDRY